jgi:hypothetical protein
MLNSFANWLVSSDNDSIRLYDITSQKIVVFMHIIMGCRNLGHITFVR